MRLQVEAAPILFPDCSIREGLRRIGWSAYSILLDSHIGRVIFGVLGGNLRRIFALTSRGYGVSLTRGKAEVLRSGANFVSLRLTQIHNFVDSYQVDVMEGVLRHNQRSGQVFVRRHAPLDVELFVHWDSVLREAS